MRLKTVFQRKENGSATTTVGKCVDAKRQGEKTQRSMMIIPVLIKISCTAMTSTTNIHVNFLEALVQSFHRSWCPD